MGQFDGLPKTTSLKLNKPGYDNVADILALNENADILDSKIAEILNAIIIASQNEAELGNDNAKMMTPLRVKQAILKLAPKPAIASQAEAEAGTDNTKMMTPLRTKQAVIKLRPLYSGAAAHNSIYRGKSLGSSVTAEQWNAIKAGTFDDLYIGDYWTIGGVDYVIAAFDYYLHTGDTECTKHHVTIVPRGTLYNHVMNDTNIVTGAYIGSKMYKSGLNQAKTTITNAFGSSHILTIRQLYTTTTNLDYGFGTAFEWQNDSIFLMNEVNVYGCYPFTEFYRTTQWGSDKYSIDNSQYPIFAFDKTMIHARQSYWLRNVASSTYFAYVTGSGTCGTYDASSSFGVRPAFNIYQS